MAPQYGGALYEHCIYCRPAAHAAGYTLIADLRVKRRDDVDPHTILATGKAYRRHASFHPDQPDAMIPASAAERPGGGRAALRLQCATAFPSVLPTAAVAAHTSR